MTTLVIGMGPAGLAAVKSLKDAGLPVEVAGGVVPFVNDPPEFRLTEYGGGFLDGSFRVERHAVGSARLWCQIRRSVQ